MIRILSSDTATKSSGWSVLDLDIELFKKTKNIKKSIHYIDSGKIKISDGNFMERLPYIYYQYKEVFDKYNPIDYVVLEDIFIGKNIDSTLKLAKTHGLVFALGLDVNAKMKYYHPTTIKKQLTNDASAKKGQVSRMVCELLNLKLISNKDNDISDAIGIGICHCKFLCRGVMKNANKTK